MRNSTKTWLIVAASLILAGAILFVGVMAAMKWEFKKLSTVKYETNVYDITEEYQNISIVTNTADLILAASPDGISRVTCNEQERVTHTVSVKDGTLTVTVSDTRKWYDYIGISLGTPTVTLSLPAGAYGALTTCASTGNVTVTGEFSFTDVTITQITGDVQYAASATGAVSIKTNTGDVKVSGISAAALSLTVTSGKVTVADVNCAGAVSMKAESSLRP